MRSYAGSVFMDAYQDVLSVHDCNRALTCIVYPEERGGDLISRYNPSVGSKLPIISPTLAISPVC